MAVQDWKQGHAVRFPSVLVTKGLVQNGSGATTYLFNGHYLVQAIMDGLFGDSVAETWKAAPLGLTDRLFDIAGIFRTLNRGSFDFEVIYIPTVMERDGWHCHICNAQIDRTMERGQDRWSLDHVIPLARGGSHTYDNVKALLGDKIDPARKKPPHPTVQCYQQGRLILRRVGDVPPDAVASVGPGESLDLGGGHFIHVPKV